MTDHDAIHEALRALADAPGEPDEDAAWARVRARVRPRRRSPWIAAGGLAVAGAAAAALVVVAGEDDGREALEVEPAATTTSTPATTGTTDPTDTTSTTGGATVGLPERPIAVVSQLDGATTRLDLYDADTGELVTRGLATTVFSISEVSIAADGTVFFTEESGDSSAIRAVPWDGSDEPTNPLDLESETSGATLGPDGRTLAFVHQGITVAQARVGLLDRATGETRFLEWAPDEEDFFLTNGSIHGLEWSPDGERLLFSLGYEGNEVRVVDADASSLSDSTDVGLAAFDAHWAGPATIVGLRFCCYPDFDEPRELRRVNLFGPDDGTVPPLGEIVAFDIDDSGTTAIVRPDGSVEIVAPDGTTSPSPLRPDEPAIDVGF